VRDDEDDEDDEDDNDNEDDETDGLRSSLFFSSMIKSNASTFAVVSVEDVFLRFSASSNCSIEQLPSEGDEDDETVAEVKAEMVELTAACVAGESGLGGGDFDSTSDDVRSTVRGGARGGRGVGGGLGMVGGNGLVWNGHFIPLGST